MHYVTWEEFQLKWFLHTHRLYVYRRDTNDQGESNQTKCGSVRNLNTIYLTSITQKAQRTYKRVLEDADVGVLWSYVVEETGEPGENHRPWTGDHYRGPSQGFWGTGEQRHLFQGNRGTNVKFWGEREDNIGDQGTWIKSNARYLGNRGTSQFSSGEQGNRYPPPPLGGRH